MIHFEGIDITIDWDKLTLGGSFFIPTLDDPELIHLVYTEARMHNFTLIHQARIELEMSGVRFWRVQEEED